MAEALALTGKRVLIPLPAMGYDPSTVAVPWMKLRSAGAQVIFATPDGQPATANPITLPLFFSRSARHRLVAEVNTLMQSSPEFSRPLCWEALDPMMFDGIVLPGGHGVGMRSYLESARLQQKLAVFFGTGRPVGAIGRGPVLLARARHPRTGLPLLHGRSTTALPRSVERAAWLLSPLRVGPHFRPYTVYVEDEVSEAVGEGGRFVRGPLTGAFVVQDGNYVSARSGRAAWAFADAFVEKLSASTATPKGKVLRLVKRAA